MEQSTFNAERAFQLIQEQLVKIRSLQKTDHTEIGEIKGMMAEIFVIAKRLDEERLIEHHRLNQVIEDVSQLKRRFA